MLRNIFDWLPKNLRQSDPNKCHLLVNTNVSIILNVEIETIRNATYQKLLGILLTKQFCFNDHKT